MLALKVSNGIMDWDRTYVQVRMHSEGQIATVAITTIGTHLDLALIIGIMVGVRICIPAQVLVSR